MRFSLFVLSLLVISTMIGCGTPSGPPIPPTVDLMVSKFYTPLSTALKYNYKHTDFRGAGFSDSLFACIYQGISTEISLDSGMIPVQHYLFGAPASPSLETYAYVSDSEVVEYGTNCHTNDNRLILLKAPLDSGASWIAAKDYVTPDGRKVTIRAEVEHHYESLTVGPLDNLTEYKNVYPVSYRVIAGESASNVNAEYQIGSRHQIFFAENAGRIEEFSFNAAAKALWRNDIQTVTVR